VTFWSREEQGLNKETEAKYNPQDSTNPNTWYIQLHGSVGISAVTSVVTELHLSDDVTKINQLH